MLGLRKKAELSFIQKYYDIKTEKTFAVDIRWFDNYSEFLTNAKKSEPQACDNAQIAEAIRSYREFKGEYIQNNEILWGLIEKMYGARHEVIIKDSNIQNKRSMKNKQEFFRGDVTSI